MRSKEQYAIHTREGPGIGDPRLESFEERRHERVFPAEPGQQGEVDVHGLTRFTPALNGQTADEAEPPVFRLTDGLEL